MWCDSGGNQTVISCGKSSLANESQEVSGSRGDGIWLKGDGERS